MPNMDISSLALTHASFCQQADFQIGDLMYQVSSSLSRFDLHGSLTDNKTG